MPSQCAAPERVLYSCVFPRGVGSLCASGSALHYRYGPLGKPAIDLASLPDWSNVHFGSVRGQGDGYQRYVRLTTPGGVHYIVYEGMNGYLTESHGHTYSGITAVKGVAGDTVLASLECKGASTVALEDRLIESKAAEDAEGSPFEMWY